MKKILLAFFLFIALGAACSSLPSLILKFQDRRYRPCSEKEVEILRPNTEAQMLFCWRHCVKYKTWRRHVTQNCKVWDTDVLETKEDFQKIRAAGFVLINEKRIY